MAKINRQTIINRAKQIIKEYPYAGKNVINKQLRHELGSGLRSSEILNIKRTLIPTTYTEHLKEQRKQSFIKKGFLPEESKYYTDMGVKLSEPGTRRLINYRQKEINLAKQSGIKDINRYIRDSYASSGWINKEGTIRPELYNENIFTQLTTSIKNRLPTLLINPENYSAYQKTIKDNFTPAEASNMAHLIPPAQWVERMRQYKYLRSRYYSHREAYQIITATSTDKDGKQTLQPLNLYEPLWRQQIQERLNYAHSMIKEGLKKGMTPQQAIIAVRSEIYNKTKDNRPSDTFAWYKEWYKITNERSTIDFQDAAYKRSRRMQKKKMAYKIRG